MTDRNHPMLVDWLECGCSHLVNPLVHADEWQALTAERREQINDMLRHINRWHTDWIVAYSSDEFSVALERLERDADDEFLICTPPDHIRTFVEVVPL